MDTSRAEQAQAAMRGAVYGEVVNLSLLEMFTPGERVLDVGCGTGAWASALRAKGARHLVGIEISPIAADLAATRYDQVLRDPIEQTDLTGQAFDTIIAADVLELLVDPWEQLARWRGWVVAGGQLVVSVPNLQSAEIVTRLLRGRFAYRDGGGMMDRTHLRWFTHASMNDALLAAGWTAIVWGRPVLGKRRLADRLTGHTVTSFLQRQIQVIARSTPVGDG
jgi:2-polyprenyl-3-methyl-5-hydroxy-6-metoxy-1,4-benzoquinol methylase